jgi:flavorubredoxin
MVTMNDIADRPPRALADGETLSLGRRTLRWLDTPHLPHGWDSGLLIDETTRTLFCGDLFTQPGAETPPVSEGDILGSSEEFRRHMNYYSNPPAARVAVERLASLAPETLACMHGSAWRGNGAKLLQALAEKLAP